MMDPYEVLGLPCTATFQEVRSRYIELARRHHPDKLSHKTPEERRQNEAFFQQVSEAYHTIDAKGSGYDNEKPELPKHWRGIWESLMQQHDVWGCVRTVLAKTVYDTVCRVGRMHRFVVRVSMEEVYTKKQKRVQLFLQGVDDPVLWTIDCGMYPEQLKFLHNDHTIYVGFELKDHDVFWIEDETTLDIATELRITWLEYVQGCTRRVVLLDGSYVEVIVEPFGDDKEPRVVLGKGLKGDGTGSLHVHIRVCAPSYEAWSRLDPEKQQIFVSITNALF